MVNHRRAVSAAYYALFHAICLAAARQVLPSSAHLDEIYSAARWVDHGDVKAVSLLVDRCSTLRPIPAGRRPSGLASRLDWLWEMFSTPDARGTRTSVVPAPLRLLVQTVPDLQDARHLAGYDHRASFPKITAVNHVEAAGRAVTALATSVSNPFVQRYLTLVIARASRFRASG